MKSTDDGREVQVAALEVEEQPTERREANGDVDRVVMEASTLKEAEVPTRILIAPWGEVRSSAGSFVLDEEAAAATVEAFCSHGTDLPVDYEHQTLGGAYSSPSGQAPAAGWIKVLSVVTPDQALSDDNAAEPGLWANVEWTPEATERLRSREYRYLSPVALVRRSDRRLVGVHSVALTNKPAIQGMRPVVNQAGAPKPSADACCIAASELRRALAMDESAGDEIVLVTAVDRIRSMQQAERHRSAVDRVSRAMSAGKLTTAQRDWAFALAEGDPAGFDAWEAAAPVLVPLGRMAVASSGGEGPAGVRAAEMSARAEWRANRAFLEQLCSEDAYVANAVRKDANR